MPVVADIKIVSTHPNEDEARRAASRLWDEGRWVAHVATRQHVPLVRTVDPWLVIEKVRKP